MKRYLAATLLILGLSCTMFSSCMGSKVDCPAYSKFKPAKKPFRV